MKMRRRNFIAAGMATAAVAVALPVLPAVVHPPCWCSCNLVRYTWRKEGHYAASYIFFDGRWQRFNYGLFRRHQRLHEQVAQER
jgi:hypothetical protein